MEKKSIPGYYGLRIYLSSTILYFMLVIPFLIFLGIQSIPQFAKNKDFFNNDSSGPVDSLAMALDSIENISEENLDSIIDRTTALGLQYADTAVNDDIQAGLEGSASKDNDLKLFEERSPHARYYRILFLMLMVSYLAGFIYNWRFKRYFKLKRRRQQIPQKIFTYCKKQLFNTPVVNSVILIMPNIVVFIYSLIFIASDVVFKEEVERNMFVQLQYLTLVATLLEFLFVYYWQKHRVHLSYIDHLYTEEELRVQVFRRKGGKIRNRFLIASGMTTFLPLVVVMVYLILSLTSISELNLENISREQKDILFGPWGTIVNNDRTSFSLERFDKLFYVNAVDSLVMLVGIGNGILVSLIYLFLFIKWTGQDITRPLKELLTNIRNTRGGQAEMYTLVRTNDEIGELAEGYNEMTKQIHDYVERISNMNRDLEAKVKERTNEVVMQKEEIEAQKEEIEAQLDMATQQRDTISRQKEQILDSIRYAERIQSAILPPVENLSDYLADHFILFKPRDIVSGDYYWTSVKDDKLLIAVADCTGHGVPGALLSMLGISFMNEIVNRSEVIQASLILDQLRKFVIGALHQTGSRGESQDGIEIALCVIDIRKKVMEYAGANRPVYLISKNGRGASPSSCTLKHLKADKMPIGIYQQETLPFTNHQIKLKRNDSLYLFSDGYVDQLGGPRRKTFRSRHFRELLLDIQEHPMEEQKLILEEKLMDWQGDVEQIDDILVIGVRV